jgi:hypothetical protein
MGRGKAFVDVLDDLLDGPAGHAGRPAPPPFPGGFQDRVATHSYFWFEQGLKASAAVPPLAGTVADRAPEPPPRPRRTLSPRQQQALDVLVGLGGRLESDFTPDDLRRVYRTLARRYHPDGNPGCSDVEKAQLASQFARAHDAYEHLKSVPGHIH